MHASGQLAHRPRNAIERMVVGKALGRPRRSDTDPVKQAAMLVVQRVKQDGVSKSQAAREAADLYGVNFETVRKCARTLLNGPQVRVKNVQRIMGVQTVDEKKVPFLHSVDVIDGAE